MIIYNAKKRPNSVFLKFSFLFWPVLLLIVFFFFFSPDKGNSIKADFDSFNPVTNVGGDAGRAILDTFGGLGAGIGGQFTDADLGAMEAYYVGGGYMTKEQFQAAAAAYVEANVDPQFEGSLEDFTVFLGDYVGVADLPRYEPTVPEYPADSSSPPSAESIPANPSVPAAGDQPTAVEGGALPAETSPAAENPENVDANIPVAGNQTIVGEDPMVAATLVSLEDGENNTIQRRCSEGLTL